MTISYQYPRDTWKHFPGVEEITFTPQVGDAVPGVKAKRQPVPLRAQGSGITFGGGVGVDVTIGLFLLWDEFLDGNKPKGGDTITQADGGIWIISRCQPEKGGAQWRCFVTQEKI